MTLANTATRMVTDKLPKVLDAKTHAIFDYTTAGGFFLMAAMFWGRNKRASIAAAMCGGAITATSLLTNYPGGVKKVISFQTHGRIDVGLAGLTASMPNFMAFSDENESKYFRGAALVETVITGLTDFNSAVASDKVVEIRSRTA
jgi:hypothetical protein